MAIKICEDFGTIEGVGPVEVTAVYVPSGSPTVTFSIGAWGKAYTADDVKKVLEALRNALERGKKLGDDLDRVMDRKQNPGR